MQIDDKCDVDTREIQTLKQVSRQCFWAILTIDTTKAFMSDTLEKK